MPTNVVRFGLDPTGTNPANKVLNEPHTLASRRIRAIATAYGPFYATGVVITDAADSRILVLDVDYSFAELDQTLTTKFNKGIYRVVLITNELVSANVTITYQAVGDIYSYSAESLVALIEQRLDTNPAINYQDLIGKPDAYSPVPHLHDAGDVFGFEYVVEALERVRNAILWSDTASYDGLIKYFNSRLAEIDQKFNVFLGQHFDAAVSEMRRTITKTTIGLGNVQNLFLATYNEGNWAGNPANTTNSIPLNKYIGLDGAMGLRDKILDLAARKDLTGLGDIVPKQLTLTRANLASLTNGSVFSALSRSAAAALGLYFEIGTYPTGSDLSHAYQVVKVNNNTNNRGGVFLYIEKERRNAFFATMSDVDQYPIFQPILLGTMLSDAVASLVDILNQHAANTANPHHVTKTQVDLGLVENLMCVNETEVNLKSEVRKYITLADLVLFCRKHVWAPIYPAAGTIIRYYCNGTTKMAEVADGAGGSTNRIEQQNSPYCGWTPPVVITYNLSMTIQDATGTTLGYAFSVSDTPRDPRAITPFADAGNTISGFMYPQTYAGITREVKDATGTTLGWLADTPSIVV